MPDSIASHLPVHPMPLASNDPAAPTPADAAATPEPTGWRHLPAEVVAHIGGFLPWQALDALGQTHRQARDALAPCTVKARIGWRTASVSSLSMLRRTLAELHSPLLSHEQRAQALGALAQRLPSLDGSTVSAARDALLGGARTLPVAVRAQPLVGLMEGLARLGRCRRPIRHRGGAMPLWRAVVKLDGAQRAKALIACLRIPSIEHDAMPPIERWINAALRLPMPDRGTVLAQVLQRFPIATPTLGDDRVQLFLRACAALQTPDGKPSWTEQAALLAALADALGESWKTGEVPDDAAQALWVHLLEAAEQLPGRFALDVMGALAGWRARHGEGAAQRWTMLWKASQACRADSAQYVRWLTAMAGAWAEPEDTWHRVFDAARSLPPGSEAPVLVMLARAIKSKADRSDRAARWQALYEHAMAAPLDARTAPLAALADTLVSEEAPEDDQRWMQVLDALPSLSAASQFQVMLACIDFGTAERFWHRCRGQIAQLPAEQHSAALVSLGEHIAQLRLHRMPAMAWRDIAESVKALPPAQRPAPLQVLVRRMNTAFESDPDGLRAARDRLAELLAEQPPVVRQQCLLLATWNADADRCAWILAQSRHLPAALQAEVLARVAQRAGAYRYTTWNAGQRIAIWVELLLAVRELPTHYRGAPLQEMARLLADLPSEQRRQARPHFVALLRGVPRADIPAGFAPPDPFSESAMVRRALKRPRYPEVGLGIAPKRERVDETWP